MKNYIGFVNDHSGSMKKLQVAAVRDYNANITAIRDAANREMLDTVVSAVAVGIGEQGYGCTRQIVISNPHVLKPMTYWQADGGTPLYDGVGDMLELFKSLPDYNSPDVSFLVMTTTDGEEAHSRKYTRQSLAKAIQELQATGRWTFVFRVPKGAAHTVTSLGVPLDNIQEWDTSTKGMEASTLATTKAVDSYFTARTAGKKSSNVFYANAANVSSSQIKANLEDISQQVSAWNVLNTEDGSEIKPFAEQRLGSSPFLKGAAFYQLTKTEARVQDNKMIIIRDKSNGHVYYGPAARDMIGLPHTGTVRLHPGDHGNYDIFIQSTSINRKLVSGTQVLYWPKVGSGFQPSDFPWLDNGTKIDPANSLIQKATAAIQATAAIHASPTGVTWCISRSEARRRAAAVGKRVKDAGSGVSPRWYF